MAFRKPDKNGVRLQTEENMMTTQPEFDIEAAHKYFAANCFNKAWDLIDKARRSEEEDEQMLQMNQASLYHWLQRKDCNPVNLSVGYWQTSRIYALLGRPDEAVKYGLLCLKYAKGQDPFYIGYAYEALARAEMMAGNTDKAREHLARAKEAAGAEPDEDNRKMLIADLQSIA
ncbi:MAG: hypothetical protein JSU65_13585 [Candidatus Zixiibacteriota bacterium]|nr:MAG: hypothetical protein JSU65_13585 [candidate division Zixibacteria bacterium]